jgi:hypothetical protein
MGQKKTIIQTGAWSPSWGYSLEASASMAQYPTTQNRNTGSNYHVTSADGLSKQLNSATRNGNDSTTNVDIYTAYSTKYPNNTTKAGWVDGVSPKNR